MTAQLEAADPGDDEDMNALMEEHAANIRIEESADSEQPQPQGRCPAAFVASLPKPSRHGNIVAQNAIKARTPAGSSLGTALAQAKVAAAGQPPARTAATNNTAAAAASTARGSGTPAGKTARQTAPGTDKGDQQSSSSSSQ